MKFTILNRVTLSVTFLAVGAFCQNLHADWGSLRGNNRSAGAPIQSAPRAQPQVSRAPQPTVRPEPQQTIRPEPQPAIRPEPQPVVRAPEPIVREQPRVVEPVRPPASADHVREPQQSPARASEADRRRMDIDEDRRQSFFWSDYHRGMRVDRLPDGYRRIGIRGHFFFYYGGVYYDNEPSGYVVVDPPLDADIPDLPPGAETVQVGGTVYYYVDGAFYVQQPDGSYVIVAAPMGVTVSMLPSDAVPVGINGTTYYQSGGTYYLPVIENGVTAYLTVPQP